MGFIGEPAIELRTNYALEDRVLRDSVNRAGEIMGCRLYAFSVI